MTFTEYLSFLNSDSFKKALHAVLSTTEKVVLTPRKNFNTTNCVVSLAKSPVFDGEWFDMYFEIFLFDKKIEIYKSDQFKYDDYDNNSNEKIKIPVFSIPAEVIESFIENFENINNYVKTEINKYNKEMVNRYIQYRRKHNKDFRRFSQKKRQISETVLDQ